MENNRSLPNGMIEEIEVPGKKMRYVNYLRDTTKVNNLAESSYPVKIRWSCNFCNQKVFYL